MMNREYRISQQPSGFVIVTESSLDDEGRVLEGLWSETCTDLVAATYKIQDRERTRVERPLPRMSLSFPPQ